VRKGSGLAHARGDNIGHPYTGCDRHGNLILIPNSDAGSLDERSAWERWSWLQSGRDAYIRITTKSEAETMLK
jgi:hypothetical protein